MKLRNDYQSTERRRRSTERLFVKIEVKIKNVSENFLLLFYVLFTHDKSCELEEA